MAAWTTLLSRRIAAPKTLTLSSRCLLPSSPLFHRSEYSIGLRTQQPSLMIDSSSSSRSYSKHPAEAELIGAQPSNNNEEGSGSMNGREGLEVPLVPAMPGFFIKKHLLVSEVFVKTNLPEDKYPNISSSAGSDIVARFIFKKKIPH